jgi:cadmium resistance protein CadD (predicted permease)
VDFFGGSMIQLVPQLGIGLAVFVSSNVDDLFLLVAFFAASAFGTRSIVIGQFLGIGALVVVSALAALTVGSVPLGLVRLLGLVPIGIGLHQLISRRRDTSPASHVEALEAARGGRSRILAVAGITVANGGDNLGIYIPLFTSSAAWIPLFAAEFAALTAAWCWLALSLARHPMTAWHLTQHARRWLPLILIALGVYIMWGTPATR